MKEFQRWGKIRQAKKKKKKKIPGILKPYAKTKRQIQRVVRQEDQMCSESNCSVWSIIFTVLTKSKLSNCTSYYKNITQLLTHPRILIFSTYYEELIIASYWL